METITCTQFNAEFNHYQAFNHCRHPRRHPVDAHFEEKFMENAHPNLVKASRMLISQFLNKILIITLINV